MRCLATLLPLLLAGGCAAPYYPQPPPRRQAVGAIQITKFHKLGNTDGQTFAVVSGRKDPGIEDETYLGMVSKRLEWFALKPASVLDADYIVTFTYSTGRESYLIEGTTEHANKYGARIQFFSGDSFRAKHSDQLLDWRIGLAMDEAIGVPRAIHRMLNEAFTTF